MSDHAVLDRLAAAAKLQQSGADRRVVHLREIPRRHFVGDAHCRGHGAELHAQEFRIARADVGRGAEGHVLARLEDLQRTGLQAGERNTARVSPTFADEVVLGRLAGDEAGEHRRGLLPDEFGVVVLVELVQLHQRAQATARHGSVQGAVAGRDE